MKISQTDLNALRDKLKKYGIKYRSIQYASGFSYSMVRKVLVDETRNNEKIIQTAQKMVDTIEC